MVSGEKRKHKQVDEDVILTPFGYNVRKKSDQRHEALEKACRRYNPLTVMRHINLVANSNKDNEKTYRILRKDVDYLKKIYKEMIKGGQNDDEEIIEDEEDHFFSEEHEYDDGTKLKIKSADTSDMANVEKYDEDNNFESDYIKSVDKTVCIYHSGVLMGYVCYHEMDDGKVMIDLFNVTKGYAGILIKFIMRVFGVLGYHFVCCTLRTEGDKETHIRRMNTMISAGFMVIDYEPTLITVMAEIHHQKLL